KVRAVFADAASLHGRADHHRWECHRRTIIDRAEDKGLRAAAACPRDADALGVHVWQAQEEVERANAVVRLQAHEALQAEFGLSVGEAFAMLDLLAVCVADHVVMKYDTTHPSQLGAACLERMTRSLYGFLGSLGDLRLGGFFSRVVEPAILPMTVRAQHSGM